MYHGAPLGSPRDRPSWTRGRLRFKITAAQTTDQDALLPGMTQSGRSGGRQRYYSSQEELSKSIVTIARDHPNE
jgi:hypothetical protein